MNKIRKVLCRIGLHGWRFSHGVANCYYKCCACGKRKVVYANGGYQPVDRAWLNQRNS